MLLPIECLYRIDQPAVIDRYTPSWVSNKRFDRCDQFAGHRLAWTKTRTHLPVQEWMKSRACKQDVGAGNIAVKQLCRTVHPVRDRPPPHVESVRESRSHVSLYPTNTVGGLSLAEALCLRRAAREVVVCKG
jgi:hypothetical protein